MRLPAALGELLALLAPQATSCDPDRIVRGVSVDSRRCRPGDLFFALPGQRVDGHAFVDGALAAGAVAAVVRQGAGPGRIVVADPLVALQALAAARRQSIDVVVAITGSNGKTIVKDALAAILAGWPGLFVSPGSHNSQLGVPLSVLAAPPQTTLGIFEAGASAPGEMARLQRILAPTHGLLTNIGLAHLAGFGDRAITAAEKLTLFQRTAGWLLLPPREPLLDSLPALSAAILRYSSAAMPQVVHREDRPGGCRVTVRFPDSSQRRADIGVRSDPLIADLEAAMAAAWMLGVRADQIAERIAGFSPGPTRMEVWRSPEGVTLINDAYSADPMSVQAALRAAADAGEGRRIFVFGGMRELGEREGDEHAVIGQMAAEQGFSHLLLLRSAALERTAAAFQRARPAGHTTWVDAPEALGTALRGLAKRGDVVLVKGPRGEGLAHAARSHWASMSPRRLIVDLGAIAENMARFRRMAGPKVKILAMLKASAYGTELARVASHLQDHGADWIGVAAADEGAAARRAGVRLPILVTLLDEGEIDKAIRHQLTPVVYSFALADALIAAARRAGEVIGVHLQVDTGMGRLGVQPERIVALAQRVAGSGVLRPTGLMTHLSSADTPDADAYTAEQLARFTEAIAAAEAAGFTGLLHHAAASAAAVRHPSARLGMIRLGLALYGVTSSLAMADGLALSPALTLLGRITHTATFRRGQRIGYSGTYTVEQESLRVGIVGMGYNDGIPWRLSNRGYALLRGRRAAFVGRVSMDSLAVDLSCHPEVEVGEEVLFFGTHEGHTLRPEVVAELAGTIPYELMVRVDRGRVQRLFIGD